MVLVDFNENSSLHNWRIINDGVMGGVSKGSIKISEEGFLLFYGNVSLENNGGFTSVRHLLEKKNINDYSKFVLKVKGDGKKYQFRVKDDSRYRYSYVYEFQTTGEWEEIRIPINEMYPSAFGVKLDLPNYNGNQLEELSFLIANKKNERFELLIDLIRLE